MNVVEFSPFFVAALVFGISGFTLGRVQRERRLWREARDNLALANSRADNKPVAESDVDHHGTGDALNGVSGRRAIPRPDVRARTGRYAASRAAGRTNAATLTLPRDYSYDG